MLTTNPKRQVMQIDLEMDQSTSHTGFLVSCHKMDQLSRIDDRLEDRSQKRNVNIENGKESVEEPPKKNSFNDEKATSIALNRNDKRDYTTGTRSKHNTIDGKNYSVRNIDKMKHKPILTTEKSGYYRNNSDQSMDFRKPDSNWNIQRRNGYFATKYKDQENREKSSFTSQTDKKTAINTTNEDKNDVVNFQKCMKPMNAKKTSLEVESSNDHHNNFDWNEHIDGEERKKNTNENDAVSNLKDDVANETDGFKKYKDEGSIAKWKFDHTYKSRTYKKTEKDGRLKINYNKLTNQQDWNHNVRRKEHIEYTSDNGKREAIQFSKRYSNFKDEFEKTEPTRYVKSSNSHDSSNDKSRSSHEKESRNKKNDDYKKSTSDEDNMNYWNQNDKWEEQKHQTDTVRREDSIHDRRKYRQFKNEQEHEKTGRFSAYNQEKKSNEFKKSNSRHDRSDFLNERSNTNKSENDVESKTDGNYEQSKSENQNFNDGSGKSENQVEHKIKTITSNNEPTGRSRRDGRFRDEQGDRATGRFNTDNKQTKSYEYKKSYSRNDKYKFLDETGSRNHRNNDEENEMNSNYGKPTSEDRSFNLQLKNREEQSDTGYVKYVPRSKDAGRFHEHEQKNLLQYDNAKSCGSHNDESNSSYPRKSRIVRENIKKNEMDRNYNKAISDNQNFSKGSQNIERENSTGIYEEKVRHSTLECRNSNVDQEIDEKCNKQEKSDHDRHGDKSNTSYSEQNLIRSDSYGKSRNSNQNFNNRRNQNVDWEKRNENRTGSGGDQENEKFDRFNKYGKQKESQLHGYNDKSNTRFSRQSGIKTDWREKNKSGRNFGEYVCAEKHGSVTEGNRIETGEFADAHESIRLSTRYSGLTLKAKTMEEHQVVPLDQRKYNDDSAFNPEANSLELKILTSTLNPDAPSFHLPENNEWNQSKESDLSSRKSRSPAMWQKKLPTAYRSASQAVDSPVEKSRDINSFANYLADRSVAYGNSLLYNFLSLEDAEIRKFENALNLLMNRKQILMIEEREEDLFNNQDFSLAHCVAEDMLMSSGIATEFRRRFNNVALLLNQRQKEGGLAYLKENDGRFIYYLVTKRESREKPTYHTLWLSLQKLKEHVVLHNVKSIAMPRIGCGLDKLEWRIVKAMLQYIFRNTVKIVVCNLKMDETSVSISRSKIYHRRHLSSEVGSASLIIYFACEDGSLIQTANDLKKKFGFIGNFSGSSNRLGTIMFNTYKNAEKVFIGCIVKKRIDDVFDFVHFQSCLHEIESLNSIDKYHKVSFDKVEDDDENGKILNLMSYSLSQVNIYCCSCDTSQDSLNDSLNRASSFSSSF